MTDPRLASRVKVVGPKGTSTIVIIIIVISAVMVGSDLSMGSFMPPGWWSRLGLRGAAPGPVHFVSSPQPSRGSGSPRTGLLPATCRHRRRLRSYQSNRSVPHCCRCPRGAAVVGASLTSALDATTAAESFRPLPDRHRSSFEASSPVISTAYQYDARSGRRGEQPAARKGRIPVPADDAPRRRTRSGRTSPTFRWLAAVWERERTEVLIVAAAAVVVVVETAGFVVEVTSERNYSGHSLQGVPARWQQRP